MLKNQRILFGVLNWGLGHASRSIPLIRQLLQNNEIVIASDGEALKLLQKEFPHLKFEKLPTYSVQYSNHGVLLPLYLLWQSPKIWKAIIKENKQVDSLIKKNKITQIISDNRYGFYHKNIPSIFITHQLRVLSGFTTPVSTAIQHFLIKRFQEIWVPDFEGKNNLSGKLSHDIKLDVPVRYIGPQSRLKKQSLKKKYDILAVLSGPEPQRTLLEKKLMKTFVLSDKKIALVQGKPTHKIKTYTYNNIDLYNFLLSDDLERIINASDWIISRSGYSTIMDLHFLQKNALLIPTPGQTEQIYLAKYLKNKKNYIFCSQSNFSVDIMNKLIIK